MAILNMVRQGLFGELIHLQGGYQHNLQGIAKSGQRENRRRHRLRIRRKSLSPEASLAHRTLHPTERRSLSHPRHRTFGPLCRYQPRQHIHPASAPSLRSPAASTIMSSNIAAKPTPAPKSASTTGRRGHDIHQLRQRRNHPAPARYHLAPPLLPRLPRPGHQRLMDGRRQWRVCRRSSQRTMNGIRQKPGSINTITRLETLEWQRSRRRRYWRHGLSSSSTAFIESIKRKPPTPEVDRRRRLERHHPAQPEQSIELGNQTVAFPDFTSGQWMYRKPTFALTDEY